VPSDSSVQILLVDSRDYGQVVLKKTGCGQAAP
jgi:hypothetical protein